jgi:bacillopeptidase F
MRKRSRLAKRQETRTRRNLFLSLVGIIAIVFVLVKFGVPALANFAIFLSGFKESQTDTKKEVSFVPSPILDSSLTATNSAQVIISGSIPNKGSIEIYVNNELTDTFDTEKDGSFSKKITLKSGENTIKARAETDNKNSDFSNILSITYIKSAPSLTIVNPANGQSFKKSENKVLVTGQTDSGVTVTVNGFWALIDDTNSYSYELPLKDGDNEIIIIATDQAGNNTEKTVKVTYSQ